MKNAYRFFKGKSGYFYIQENSTGRQKSLKTTDRREAEKLLNAANEARQSPDLNLHLGKTYLAHANPDAEKRIWQDGMDELRARNKETTRLR